MRQIREPFRKVMNGSWFYLKKMSSDCKRCMNVANTLQMVCLGDLLWMICGYIAIFVPGLLLHAFRYNILSPHPHLPLPSWRMRTTSPSIWQRILSTTLTGSARTSAMATTLRCRPWLRCTTESLRSISTAQVRAQQCVFIQLDRLLHPCV